MRYLVAIDPGYAKGGKGCALALFQDGVLAWAGFERDQPLADYCLIGSGGGTVTVVWEIPQVDGRSLRSAQEIVKLAGAGGVLAGCFAGANPGAEVRAYEPRVWKGATSKPIHHKRLWAVLSDAERSVFPLHLSIERTIDAACAAGGKERWAKPGVRYYPSGWHTHNLLDAAALGCFELGRLGS